MSGGMGGNGVPGIGAARSVYESEILWGSGQSRSAVLWQSKKVSGAIRDAGNSPTTVLRPGLIVGVLTSSGELEEFDVDATDGTQNVAGILDIELRAQDYDGTNQDRVCRLITARAPVKARKLLIEGAAFVGHAGEFVARRQLAKAGFVFDDDPFNYKSGLNERESVKADDYTVLSSDNGTRFTSITADTTYTLPAIQAGLEFDFIKTTNHELVVASAEGDNMVVGNDYAADSITFTTADEQIGARVKVKGAYLNGTLKWIAELPQAPFGTAAGSAMTIAIAT